MIEKSSTASGDGNRGWFRRALAAIAGIVGAGIVLGLPALRVPAAIA
jgi:hypothetical protein